MPVMAWDLRAALLKKGEFETARLAEFEFRWRVRAYRALADDLGAHKDRMIAALTRFDDDQLLDRIQAGHPDRDIHTLFAECRARTRHQLIAEIGDPTPHRLL